MWHAPSVAAHAGALPGRPDNTFVLVSCRDLSTHRDDDVCFSRMAAGRQ